MTGENQPVKAIFVKGVTISKKGKKALAFCRRCGIIYMFIFCHMKEICSSRKKRGKGTNRYVR